MNLDDRVDFVNFFALIWTYYCCFFLYGFGCCDIAWLCQSVHMFKIFLSTKAL